MSGSRHRINIDDEYILALGRMTYIFAGMEWEAIWCCKFLSHSYIGQLKKKTAGIIAKEFIQLAKAITDAENWDAALKPAEKFAELVELRNSILHGKPCTAPSGEQRLLARGLILLTVNMIDDASDKFAECSIALNSLRQEMLKFR